MILFLIWDYRISDIAKIIPLESNLELSKIFGKNAMAYLEDHIPMMSSI
jgi:hypothetical protein